MSDEDEAGGQQAEPWGDKKRSCGHGCQDPHRQTNAQTLQKQLGARESRDGPVGQSSEFFSRGSNIQGQLGLSRKYRGPVRGIRGLGKDG